MPAMTITATTTLPTAVSCPATTDVSKSATSRGGSALLSRSSIGGGGGVSVPVAAGAVTADISASTSSKMLSDSVNCSVIFTSSRAPYAAVAGDRVVQLSALDGKDNDRASRLTLLSDGDDGSLRNQPEYLPDDAKEGLFNIRALSLLSMWYFFSFCTLFLNKYILSFMQGEPTLLGAIQMLSTTVLGFCQMYVPCGLYQPVERRGKPSGFIKNMVIVGSMRFSTVVLGLLALKYISVSFTETVKSSAPIFTVLFARLVLGEQAGVYVVISLVPVMGGLALCSAYELSFHMIGFLAALATNLMDCLQNVFSKLLISGEEFKYTPAELQFYTSVASIIVQIPCSIFVMDFDHAKQDLTSSRMAFALFANGCCFHLQSITAYALMGYISPVTHSVANTAKRALLIWLSVLIFANEVTILSALGTAMVTFGVLVYHRARDYEERQKALDISKKDESSAAKNKLSQRNERSLWNSRKVYQMREF